MSKIYISDEEKPRYCAICPQSNGCKSKDDPNVHIVTRFPDTSPEDKSFFCTRYLGFVPSHGGKS